MVKNKIKGGGGSPRLRNLHLLLPHQTHNYVIDLYLDLLSFEVGNFLSELLDRNCYLALVPEGMKECKDRKVILY